MVDVIYIDNHLLVLNKPAGLLTQPNESEEPSLETLGKAWLKERFQKPGNVFLAAVHRLDRPASGLVLFARTSKALSRLNDSLRSHQFQKEYLALAEGIFLENEGTLEHQLEKGAFIARVSREGKNCLLHYQVLQPMEGCTLLKISLHTGRYHQIRAQLAAEGHPILGDRKYGSTIPSEHLLLHHAALSFPHPITQERIQCRADYPGYWPDITRCANFDFGTNKRA